MPTIFNPVLIAGGAPSNQSVYEVLESARHMPGTQGVLSDGRLFEYVRLDQSTGITKGNLATYEPVAGGHDQATMVAAAIGDTEISFSMTITLVANELWGAYIAMESGAGLAEMYRVVSHPAHTSGAIVVQIERPVVVAITTSTDATLIHGSTSVKVSATVATLANPVEAAAGVPLVTVPAGDTTNQYFWVQKTGLCNVLFGTVVAAVGQSVYQGENAGSFQSAVIEVDTNTDRPAHVSLGTIVSLLPVDTEYHVVRLTIV